MEKIKSERVVAMLKKWRVGLLFAVFGVLLFTDKAFAFGGGQPGQEGAEAPSMLVTMFPFILMFVILYLLIIRPQQRKQKDHQRLIDELKKGDRVVTSGGMHGTITGIKEQEGILVLQVAKEVQIEVSRGSISRVDERKAKK
ncbi:MAG: preprotein translocase subunit YajC [Gemmatimonadota bacterium]|nr:preprotein translocase subunit YajC [Gemmatimonadota bacterium]